MAAIPVANEKEKEEHPILFSFSVVKYLFCDMYSLYLPVSLATLVSASPFKTTNTCADFTAGACDLSETNIVEHNRFTDTPGECQVS